MKKVKKYSEIRQKLQIDVDKKTDNGLAKFTHYLQNHKNGVSEYFKNDAEEYLTTIHEKLNILEELVTIENKLEDID